MTGINSIGVITNLRWIIWTRFIITCASASNISRAPNVHSLMLFQRLSDATNSTDTLSLLRLALEPIVAFVCVRIDRAKQPELMEIDERTMWNRKYRAARSRQSNTSFMHYVRTHAHTATAFNWARQAMSSIRKHSNLDRNGQQPYRALLDCVYGRITAVERFKPIQLYGNHKIGLFRCRQPFESLRFRHTHRQ